MAEVPIVGLTEKGARLDLGMRSVFDEFVIAVGPDQWRASKADIKAVQTKFTALWKRAGQLMTPMKTSILSILRTGPKGLDEIIKEVSEESGFALSEFRKAITEMMEGGLVTGDSTQIWALS